MLHYNGSAWSNISDRDITTTTLNDVWASGNEAFAVGYNGTIIHIAGTTLTAMTNESTETLYGVWGASPTDVFAVGDKGTILHCTGTMWSPMTIVGLTSSIFSITGIGPSDVYAVAGYGFLLHYNGTLWTAKAIGYASYNARLWMPKASNLFIAYYSSMFHYDGSTLAYVPQLTYSPLYGISGSDPSNGFAVGYASTILKYGP